LASAEMARRPEDPTLRERSERALLDMARRSARWLDEQVAHREGGPVTRAPSAPPVRQGPTLPVARPRPAPERAAEVLPADQVQRLQAALSSIAMQVEGLVSSTASFRGLMTDRLTDYAEQVSHLMGTTVESVEEYRQTHENALRDLRRLVTERKDQQAEAYRKALAELRKSTDEQ